MLTDLEISGLGIIDRAALELGPGLTVLSGETGAGKTMVVTAVQWLLGARADKDKVRAGAKAARVQVRFEGVPASAGEWADPDDDELVVTREVGGRGDDDTPQGRSRARIAGQLAPVTALAEVLGEVVEIHSQHESVRLGDAVVQRALLDRWGGRPVADAREGYGRAYAAWRAAVAALEEAERSSRDDACEADRLRLEVEEIAAVDPAAGEEDDLDAEIGRLEHAESLREAATAAAAALVDEGGARDALGGAVAAVREVVAHDPALADVLSRLEGTLAEAQELGFDLSSYAEGLESDPEALDTALGRRAAIGRLLRKYGPSTADVIRTAEEAAARLALVDGGEERLAELRDAATAAEADVHRLGASLADARREAAGRLATAVDAHLAELSMPDARTEIAVVDAPPTAQGTDAVEFLLAANRGQPALPLGRAASGGERSRVALALKVALADADDTPVMVFDEVDAGIGGETALAVGRKLARLARGRQVLCVTHLAQLAAFADAHFVVSKRAAGASTETVVRRLAEGERAAELSRMLAGVTESRAALDHAEELLETARTTAA